MLFLTPNLVEIPSTVEKELLPLWMLPPESCHNRKQTKHSGLCLFSISLTLHCCRSAGAFCFSHSTRHIGHSVLSLKSFVSQQFPQGSITKPGRGRGKKTQTKPPLLQVLPSNVTRLSAKAAITAMFWKKILCLFTADESPSVNTSMLRILPV